MPRKFNYLNFFTDFLFFFIYDFAFMVNDISKKKINAKKKMIKNGRRIKLKWLINKMLFYHPTHGGIKIQSQNHGNFHFSSYKFNLLRLFSPSVSVCFFLFFHSLHLFVFFVNSCIKLYNIGIFFKKFNLIGMPFCCCCFFCSSISDSISVLCSHLNRTSINEYWWGSFFTGENKENKTNLTFKTFIHCVDEQNEVERRWKWNEFIDRA